MTWIVTIVSCQLAVEANADNVIWRQESGQPIVVA
jgi:hypothetical protein